jgi:diguanylate cyclase (GGDEF)-like protein
VVATVVNCPACGEPAEVPRCTSCGAELPIGAVDQVRDRDQTASDRDQTASDQDQTWSDHDQTASERDQRSANEDQLAADDDFAAGGDAITYQRSALARERSGRDREAVSAARAESAAARLATAADRDRAAELRDRGAEGRDALARLHDLQDDTDASREDILLRAERDRARAAADRAKAARERGEALRDRASYADDLKLATTDELTGAWTRRFGLEEVSRELERAHRTGAGLVLAFVDVDGLKAVNDNQGHLAGDALLRLLGETLRANLRPYDVIVRYGGDELLCAMPNLDAREARARFERIVTALAAVEANHSVTFGLAAAEPADSLQQLIARADAELLEARHSHTNHG